MGNLPCRICIIFIKRIFQTLACLHVILGFHRRYGGRVCVSKQRNWAMIASLTNPMGIESYSHANFLFCLD